jgi:hypothetical protein
VKGQLAHHIGEIRDPKKMDNYSAILSGYRQWWGRKALEWFEPPFALFSRSGIEVTVNPELGFRISGKPHIIKLYFKSEPLSKNRIDIITHLMEICLRDQAPAEAIMAVLDTRRGRLICPTVPIQGLSAALTAELAYVATLWNEI